MARAPEDLARQLEKGDRAALEELHRGLSTEESWAVRLLVEALRDGDEWAWRSLHEWYFARVERICLRILQDADAARDCALEVELEFVARYVHRDRVLETFPGYLWSMARTTALRQRSRRESVGLPAHLRDEATRDDDIGLRSDLWRLKSAMRELDGQHVALLRLRYAEGLTLREIAEDRGTSLQNIDQSIRRLLKKLRRLMRS